MATTETTPTLPAPPSQSEAPRPWPESTGRSSSSPPLDSGRRTDSGAADSPPVRLREVLAVIATVAVFDLFVYRGYGYAGAAAFFVAAGLLLVAGGPQRGHRLSMAILGSMLVVLAARMIWLGFGFLILLGIALLVAFAMATAGRRPYLIDAAIYGLQSLVAGVAALIRYGRSASRISPSITGVALLKFLLPALAVFGFGTIFILANPDVATNVMEWIDEVIAWIDEQLRRSPLSIVECLLWGLVALVTAGLLRPILKTWVLRPFARLSGSSSEEPLFETPLYAAYRNTLVAVIALFGAYLVFEFATLWFRTFPKGFYYAGYAHEGAAWLTVALALTTFVLSAIFRDSTMHDPRLPALRRLAWIWSGLNLLLAIAVYNRMLIYIDFNGMTRMRTVGLFGISAVVVGFLLVVWKIARDHDFAWLIERQLWTLGIAIVLLAVLPIDPLIHRYNVRRVLAGDLAPSVQITEHEVDSGGILVLPPLVQSGDPIIRDGIRALLAERASQLETTIARRETEGWTSFQLADRLLLDKLYDQRALWQEFEDPARREAAWQRFKGYAYQWY